MSVTLYIVEQPWRIGLFIVGLILGIYDIWNTRKGITRYETYDNIEDLFQAANKVIMEDGADFDSTDFRVVRRNDDETKAQRSYIIDLLNHLQDLKRKGKNVHYRRAVIAKEPPEYEILVDQLGILDPLLKNNTAECKVYHENPLSIDFLIGPESVLFALAQPKRGPRIGIRIHNRAVADKFRDWYSETIWHPARGGTEVTSADELRQWYTAKLSSSPTTEERYDYDKLHKQDVSANCMKTIHALEDGRIWAPAKIWERVFVGQPQKRELDEFGYRLMYLEKLGLIRMNSRDASGNYLYQITPLGRRFVDDARHRRDYDDVL
jgi:hypothetical protein